MARGEPDLIEQLAARAIRKNLKALAAQIPGVRARRGTEPVHDLRVASRRVRTALKLLSRAAPKRAPRVARRWLRELKRVTQALGAARDTDVQAECASEFLKKLPRRDARLRPGLERLLLRLRRRRDEEQRKIVKALGRLERSGALREMRGSFKAARARPLRAADREAGAATRQIAARQIVGRLDRMLAYERFLARPERKKELHEMRIAAKRFRYTMEALAPLFDGGLEPWVRAARKVQTDLGEIHDCDVWISQTLPGFLDEERTHAADLGLGIDALLRDRRRRRNTAYRAFLGFWKKLRRKNAWVELKRALREAR